MIRLTAYSWYDAWFRLHELFAEQPEEVIDHRFATRAVSFNNEIHVINNRLDDLAIELVGYTKYKLSLFERNYIVPGRKEAVGKVLLERIENSRKLTVVSYSFDVDNTAHEQGPCVINILVTLWKERDGWHVKYEANMRIGEITRRLLVDFLKFHEIISYWTGLLEPHKVQSHGIIFKSAALYAEPISLTIAQYVFQGSISFNQDHWLHRATQTKIADYETKELKFKRGRRIKKHVQRLQGRSNVST